MRTTSFYGIKFGALMIEKRRGTVSSIKIGMVDRNPPEGATWTLRFTATREITQKHLIWELDDHLMAARREYRALADKATLADLASYDRIIAEVA